MIEGLEVVAKEVLELHFDDGAPGDELEGLSHGEVSDVFVGFFKKLFLYSGDEFLEFETGEYDETLVFFPEIL